MNPTRNPPICCTSNPAKPWSHAPDCTTKYFNDTNPTISSSLTSSLAPEYIWQSSSAFAHYDTVVHQPGDRFLTASHEGGNTVISNHTGRLITRMQSGKVAHADMRTLESLDMYGNSLDGEVGSLRPEAFVREQDVQPVFDLPLDFSDSESERGVESDEVGCPGHRRGFDMQERGRGKHHVQARRSLSPSQGPANHAISPAHTASDHTNHDSTTSITSSDHHASQTPIPSTEQQTTHHLPPIPESINKISTQIHACPPQNLSHNLPMRKWLSKQQIPGLTARYAIFPSSTSRPSNDPSHHRSQAQRAQILRFVGDERVFCHRLWAYLLFPGGAVGQGEGEYERRYFRAYGERFGLRAEEFLAPSKWGTGIVGDVEGEVGETSPAPSSSVMFGIRRGETTSPAPSSPEMARRRRGLRMRGEGTLFTTTEPFTSSGPCSDVLGKACSAVRQTCIHYARCGNVVCTSCDRLQLQHLGTQDSGEMAKTILLGALMPLCLRCQARAFQDENGEQSGWVRQECQCTAYQCLPCLRETAAKLKNVREVYADEKRRCSVWIQGHKVGVYKCACGGDIGGGGKWVGGKGGEVDRVRVCVCCWGYKTREEVVGGLRREGEEKMGGIEWWAGCEAFLR